tara:strand:- start:663 stop:1295 length:633 start_codon:yes stop_codon:yes gene_type:complete
MADIEKGINDIIKQIKEAPLNKEEAKIQFVKVTKDLELKHTFDFDTAWEVAEEIKKRKQFREAITVLEDKITKTEGGLVGEKLNKANPVKHSFADGCYIREIFNPAGMLIVTKIHKKKHPFFLMQGDMSIITETGVERIQAPHQGITVPGTKRVIYAHTDCVFVTVHATKHTDIKKIEKEVIAEDFSDPKVALQDVELLKNIKLIKNNKL